MHAISHVSKNIDWYILEGVVGIEAASELSSAADLAVKKFVPHLNTALDGLGHTNTIDWYGPIARDYVQFNA